MKILKFLLITISVYFSLLQPSYSNEEILKKGLEIFNETAACSGCHALKAAGAEADIGPNLDTVSLTKESVLEMVTWGLGVMPAYGEEGILTKEEIDIVSTYVAEVAGK